MKQRPQRMATIVRRVVGTKLQQLTPGVYLTLTEVTVSPDLKYTTVWVSPLVQDTDDVQLTQLLAEHRAALQKEVASYVQSKFTPRLDLRVDRGGSYADKIDHLLKDL